MFAAVRRAGRLLPAAALLCGLSAAPAAAQTVTLSVPSGTSLSERGGATDILVTATLSVARAADTTVTLSLGGTARSTDYVTVSLPSITIPAEQTTGEATVVLQPVDDNFHEDLYETVQVNGSATGLTVTGVSFDLVDNDRNRPTLAVRAEGNFSLREGDSSTLTVLVRLDDGAELEDDLSVNLRVFAGSGLLDRLQTTPQLPLDFTIPAGSTTTTIRVGIRARPSSLRSLRG